MQLKQGFLMKTVTMDISFKLQHLEQISEFSEAIFLSHLQGVYCVNCDLMAAEFSMVRFLRQCGQKS